MLSFARRLVEADRGRQSIASRPAVERGRGTQVSHRTRKDDLSSAGLASGSTGLLVVASAALVLIVLWQSLGSPGGLTAAVEPVGDASVNASQNAHISAPPGVSVTRPVLVLNGDGSATLSASLATSGKEVALVGVQIVYLGSAQEVSSTDMWLPVIPGVGATVGAASEAGGFTVPNGLKAGDVADVHFVFDDRTCVSVKAEVVQRAARHGWVFPKSGSQLGHAHRSPDSLTLTCTDPVTTSRSAQGA